MTLKERLKGVGIASGILVIAFPLAVAITIFSNPFWEWFEIRTGIESVGHSGPAEWCYLATYLAIITLATIIWSRIENGAGTG